MGVAPPPPVPSGVIERVRSDVRWQRAARGGFPPGELSFSLSRTREFEREPLPLLLRLYEEFGPVFSMRLMYAPVVFALGPEANHYITVAATSHFRGRDGRHVRGGGARPRVMARGAAPQPVRVDTPAGATRRDARAVRVSRRARCTDG